MIECRPSCSNNQVPYKRIKSHETAGPSNDVFVQFIFKLMRFWGSNLRPVGNFPPRPAGAPVPLVFLAILFRSIIGPAGRARLRRHVTAGLSDRVRSCAVIQRRGAAARPDPAPPPRRRSTEKIVNFPRYWFENTVLKIINWAMSENEYRGK